MVTGMKWYPWNCNIKVLETNIIWKKKLITKTDSKNKE